MNHLYPRHQRLACAGWAIAEWARTRLARVRDKDAYRLVETELVMLVRSGQLREIPNLEPESFADVEACLVEAAGR